jgi:DNA-binding transcriptional MerR regulator/predicted RNase H-like HicB family nuclease
MADSFGSTFITQVMGISRSKLHYWDKTAGVVKPSVHPAAGTGTRRLYSYEDLIALEVVMALRELGFSLQRIRKSVRYLRERFPDLPQPLGALTFLTDGETIFVIPEDQQELEDTLRQQRVLAIPLGSIVRHVNEAVEEATTPVSETAEVDGRTYRVTIERDPETGWYIAFCEDILGCGTQGRTLDEVRYMIADAIRESVIVLEDAGAHAEREAAAL